MNEPPSMWFSSILVLDYARCLLAQPNNNSRQELKLISVVTTPPFLPAFRPVRLADPRACCQVIWRPAVGLADLSSPAHITQYNNVQITINPASLSPWLFFITERNICCDTADTCAKLNKHKWWPLRLPLIFLGMKGWHGGAFLLSGRLLGSSLSQ